MGWSNSGWRSDQGGWYKNAVASSTATWNPADKDAGITLSPGNLTATNNTGSAHSDVRATASHSTGKFYYEITAVVQTFPGFTFVGIANATEALNVRVGNSANSTATDGAGNVFLNGVNIGACDGLGSGVTLGTAFDLTAMKVWFWSSNSARWNADILANQNPATGTGGISIAGLNAGPYYPAMGIFQLNDSFTANFGGSAYVNSAPSGFGNW